MDKIICVYVIKFDNGDFYVGSTSDARKRFNRHRSLISRRISGILKMSSSDWQSFEISEVSRFQSRESSLDFEQWLLDGLVGSAGCLNVAKDARVSGRGRIVTQRERDDASARVRLFRHTEGTKARLSEILRSRGPVSDETRAKMSASRTGVKKSKEWVERASLRAKSRPVVVDGKEYRSLSLAAREIGISPSLMHKRLNSEDWNNYGYKEKVDG